VRWLPIAWIRRLQHKMQNLGPLSLSAGVAAFPEHASASDDLLKIADQCLYESKARGRDVVTMASPKTRDRIG
jgi:GGDEF domain-containing protein